MLMPCRLNVFQKPMLFGGGKKEECCFGAGTCRYFANRFPNFFKSP
jgi:hypothetical protein